MRRLQGIAMCAVCLLLPLGTLADEPKDKKDKNDGKVPALREISAKGVKFQEGGKATSPTVVKTAKDLAKVMPDEDARAAMGKEVNFGEYHLLVFSWGGSGQDKLTSEVKKGKDDDEVVFRYTPGLTRDFRMHMRLYAVRNGVTWKVETGKFEK